MSDLSKIVYLSAAQYETLKTDGTITVGSTTINYSNDDLYLTPDTTVPTGGTSGQVLTKASSSNYDTVWATPTEYAAKDASNLTDANVTSFNTKLGQDWHTFTGSAGTAIEVPVNFDKVKEFAFKVLGGDDGTFGYLSIPKDIWHNNGAYGLVVPTFSDAGGFKGSVVFTCGDKQSNSFKINSTNHGSNGTIAVSVKY